MGMAVIMALHYGNIMINGEALGNFANAFGLGNRNEIIDYETKVLSILNDLSAGKTGKILLNAISRIGKSLWIIPYIPTGEDKACGADNNPYRGNRSDYTGKIGWAIQIMGSSYREDETAKGRPVMNRDHTREKGFFSDTELTGTGKGISPTVRYSPEIWGAGTSCSNGPGSTAHAVLFHELVHSYRSMKGSVRGTPTKNGLKDYGNCEEFLAVMVSNIFIADPTTPARAVGSRTLRRDHIGFVPLPSELSTTFGFLSNPENVIMVERLKNQEPKFTKALASVDCFFNPFGENIIDPRFDAASRTA
jgi:hypothetical protein